MGADKSIKYADQEIVHFREKLGQYLQEDVREPLLDIIRLSILEAYREGWKDADRYFSEENK